MGLDSFLYRTKKIAGLTAEEYGKIESCVSNIENKESFSSIKDVMEENDYKDVYQELNEVVGQRGKYLSWQEQAGFDKSIFGAIVTTLL